MRENMFPSICCRLCLNICNGHRSLYDEHGGLANEVYELAMKYFTAELLEAEWARNLSKICLECWRHISDFHAFQQTVLLAQKSALSKSLDNAQRKTTDDNEVSVLEANSNDWLDEELDEAELWELYESGELDANDMLSAKHAQVVRNALTRIVKANVSNSQHTSQVALNPSRMKNQQEKISASKISQEKVACKSTSESNREIESDSEECMDGETAETPMGSALAFGKFSLDDEPNLSKETTITEIGNRLPSEDLAENSPSEEDVAGDVAVKLNELFAKKSHIRSIQEYDELIAIWRPNLECMICHTTRSSFSLLTKHFSQEHPEESCYILCCYYKFYHRYKIVQHLRYHVEPKRFKCAGCFKGFTTKVCLEHHKATVHMGRIKDTTFQCERCEKCFCSQQTLRRHRRIHCHGVKEKPLNKYTCSKCDKTFSSKLGLKAHTKSIHLGGKRKPHKCEICERVFYKQSALSEHMNYHTDEPPTYECQFCPMKYGARGSLYTHAVRDHPKEWKAKQIEKAKNRKRNQTRKNEARADESSIRESPDNPAREINTGTLNRMIQEEPGRASKTTNQNTEAKSDESSNGEAQENPTHAVSEIISQKKVNKSLKRTHQEKPVRVSVSAIRCSFCPMRFKFSSSLCDHVLTNHFNEKEILDSIGSLHRDDLLILNEVQKPMESPATEKPNTSCKSRKKEQKDDSINTSDHEEDPKLAASTSTPARNANYTPISCKFCPILFKFSSSLCNHVLEKHFNEKDYLNPRNSEQREDLVSHSILKNTQQSRSASSSGIIIDEELPLATYRRKGRHKIKTLKSYPVSAKEITQQLSTSKQTNTLKECCSEKEIQQLSIAKETTIVSKCYADEEMQEIIEDLVSTEVENDKQTLSSIQRSENTAKTSSSKPQMKAEDVLNRKSQKLQVEKRPISNSEIVNATLKSRSESVSDLNANDDLPLELQKREERSRIKYLTGSTKRQSQTAAVDESTRVLSETSSHDEIRQTIPPSGRLALRGNKRKTIQAIENNKANPSNDSPKTEESEENLFSWNKINTRRSLQYRKQNRLKD